MIKIDKIRIADLMISLQPTESPMKMFQAKGRGRTKLRAVSVQRLGRWWFVRFNISRSDTVAELEQWCQGNAAGKFRIREMSITFHLEEDAQFCYLAYA